jgi:hypothetical protein
VKTGKTHCESSTRYVKSLFNRWNAQVFADFPRQQIDNLVMAGDRRAFVLARIVPPRMAGTLAQQLAAIWRRWRRRSPRFIY